MRKKIIVISTFCIVVAVIGFIFYHQIIKDDSQEYIVYYVADKYYEDALNDKYFVSDSYCYEDQCGLISSYGFNSLYSYPLKDSQLESLKNNESVEFLPYYDVVAHMQVYINGELFTKEVLVPLAGLFPITKDNEKMHMEYNIEEDEQKEYVYISKPFLLSIKGKVNGEEKRLNDVIDEDDEIMLTGYLSVPSEYKIYEDTVTESIEGESVTKGPYTFYEPAIEILPDEVTFYVKGVYDDTTNYLANLCTIFVDPSFLDKYNPDHVVPKSGVVRSSDENIEEFFQKNGLSYFLLH